MDVAFSGFQGKSHLNVNVADFKCRKSGNDIDFHFQLFYAFAALKDHFQLYFPCPQGFQWFPQNCGQVLTFLLPFWAVF